MEQRIVTVIGGTGFVGRYVVKDLAQAGYTIRVISRHPDAALSLKTSGDVGQIVLMNGNLAKPESLAGKLDGSYAVVNLVGILFEAGNQQFTRLHAQGAERLAQMARTAGAQHFIHLSALGINLASGSQYARSKLIGEEAVLGAFPQATILRPGVIFGPEDNFFNQFARMASLAPCLPLIGGGRTQFQPVYVGDIAKAIIACLERSDTQSQMYELAGPRTYTFKEILEYILLLTGKRRPLLPIPFALAQTTGVPPLTRDQVKLFAHDNVLSPDAKTLKTLGIKPTPIEMIMPEYLARYQRKAAA